MYLTDRNKACGFSLSLFICKHQQGFSSQSENDLNPGSQADPATCCIVWNTVLKPHKVQGERVKTNACVMWWLPPSQPSPQHSRAAEWGRTGHTVITACSSLHSFISTTPRPAYWQTELSSASVSFSSTLRAIRMCVGSVDLMPAYSKVWAD